MKNLKKVITVLILAAVTFTSAGNDISSPSESEIARIKAEKEALEKRLAVVEKENSILKAKLEDETPSSFESDYELSSESDDESDSLFEMSLQELMELEVGTASLTKTTKRNTPSTVTTITREDIQHSGARSLIELLEIYVPNYQWVLTGIFPRHQGLRGINDSRDDKFLLLVNGRQMNEKTNFGVISERDLPMLGDIREIQVVRGPGSALYGAGALAMVINLIIDTPETFEGFETNTRAGAIEEFYSSEFKWGKKFSDDRGLLIYGGASIYPGADQDDAPILYNNHHTTKWAGTSSPRVYYRGQEFRGRDKNYNEAYKGYPKLKLHAHYMHDDKLHIWARYTQGGEYVHQSEWGSVPVETGERARDVMYGMGYRQATIATEYKQKFTDKFSVHYRFSYDQTHIETDPYNVLRELSYREDEYTGRILANWDIHENHKLAFGGEWSHEEFGLDPIGHSNTLNYRMGDNTEMPRWSSDMRSLIGEYQWGIRENLTAFLSARYDDHTMVDGMFSPRISFVYTPDKKSTYKFMYSRASRTNVAQEIKIDDLAGNHNSEYETLDAFELRYERQHSDKLWWALSAFKHSQDMVTFSYDTQRTSPVGNFKSWGVEFEGKYKKDKLEVLFSHALTKLNHVHLNSGITSTEITSAPNSYGNDFANWSNHQSKIHLNYQIKPKWLLTSSMVVYWGYPGGEDYALYRYAVGGNTKYEPYCSEAFNTSYYFNAGLEHKHSDNLTLRVDAYNILGWFDKTLGKRRFGFTPEIPGMYRVQPPSFGFQLIYRF